MSAHNYPDSKPTHQMRELRKQIDEVEARCDSLRQRVSSLQASREGQGAVADSQRRLSRSLDTERGAELTHPMRTERGMCTDSVGQDTEAEAQLQQHLEERVRLQREFIQAQRGGVDVLGVMDGSEHEMEGGPLFVTTPTPSFRQGRRRQPSRQAASDAAVRRLLSPFRPEPERRQFLVPTDVPPSPRPSPVPLTEKSRNEERADRAPASRPHRSELRRRRGAPPWQQFLRDFHLIDLPFPPPWHLTPAPSSAPSLADRRGALFGDSEDILPALRSDDWPTRGPLRSASAASSQPRGTTCSSTSPLSPGSAGAGPLHFTNTPSPTSGGALMPGSTYTPPTGATNAGPSRRRRPAAIGLTLSLPSGPLPGSSSPSPFLAPTHPSSIPPHFLPSAPTFSRSQPHRRLPARDIDTDMRLNAWRAASQRMFRDHTRAWHFPQPPAIIPQPCALPACQQPPGVPRALSICDCAIEAAFRSLGNRVSLATERLHWRPERFGRCSRIQKRLEFMQMAEEICHVLDRMLAADRAASLQHAAWRALADSSASDGGGVAIRDARREEEEMELEEVEQEQEQSSRCHDDNDLCTQHVRSPLLRQSSTSNNLDQLHLAQQLPPRHSINKPPPLASASASDSDSDEDHLTMKTSFSRHPQPRSQR